MTEKMNTHTIVVPIENVYTLEEPVPIEQQIFYENNNTESTKI
jgi:hypothetical protein